MKCSEIEELLPGYALDSLSAEDAAAVEQHLSTCQWCRESLREHQLVATALAQGVIPAQPAPSLKRELMLALGARAASRRWGTFISPRMVAAFATSVAVILMAALVTLEVRTSGQVDKLREENAALSAQVDDMSGRDDRLFDLVSSEVARNRTEVTNLVAQATLDTNSLDQMIHEQRMLAYIVASQGRTTLPLDGGVSRTSAYGVITIAGRGDIGVLVVAGLDPLPPNMQYQVWLWKNGQASSGGLFFVDDTGWGSMTFQAQEPIMALSGISITPEPAGGSSSPTSPAVLVSD